MKRLGNTLAALGGVMAVSMGAGAAEAQSAAPGYVVLEFKIKDTEGFKTYAQRAPATSLSTVASSSCADRSRRV